MSIHGIDVSEFQGRVDWDRVRKAGIQFAMLRAGYGAGSIDGEFRRNAEECNRVGIPFGVYWFSYAYTREMAKKEADYCIDAIREYEVNYPVCYDFEYASVNYAAERGVNVTRTLATEITEEFCRRVEELGYFAMYYSNLDYMRRMFEQKLKDKYSLWYAQYSQDPCVSGMAIWQYSDMGRVDGVSGNVDMDIALYDLAKVISRGRFNHLNSDRSTPDSATPEPNEVIEYVVRRGDTLQKIAEKYGTTVKELTYYNCILNPNRLFVGEVILIPLGSRSNS